MCGARDSFTGSLLPTQCSIPSQVEVAKPPLFDGEANKVVCFVTVCMLYIQMKIREAEVEKQAQ